MDETEPRAPGPVRAFTPVWFAVALLFFFVLVMPTLLVLFLRLADVSFQID
jgi:hypothetical protein